MVFVICDVCEYDLDVVLVFNNVVGCFIFVIDVV